MSQSGDTHEITADFSRGAQVFGFLWLCDKNMKCRQATDRRRLYAHNYVCAKCYYWNNSSVFLWIEVISQAGIIYDKIKEYLLFTCLLKYWGPSLSRTVTLGNLFATEVVNSTVPPAKEQMAWQSTNESWMFVVFRQWQYRAISDYGRPTLYPASKYEM